MFYYAVSFFLTKSKKVILADKHNFCNANIPASSGYPIPQAFSPTHVFSIERMQEPLCWREVNDLCHV